MSKHAHLYYKLHQIATLLLHMNCGLPLSIALNAIAKLPMELVLGLQQSSLQRAALTSPWTSATSPNTPPVGTWQFHVPSEACCQTSSLLPLLPLPAPSLLFKITLNSSKSSSPVWLAKKQSCSSWRAWSYPSGHGHILRGMVIPFGTCFCCIGLQPLQQITVATCMMNFSDCQIDICPNIAGTCAGTYCPDVLGLIAYSADTPPLAEVCQYCWLVYLIRHCQQIPSALALLPLFCSLPTPTAHVAAHQHL
jgi:hypothetical protein